MMELSGQESPNEKGVHRLSQADCERWTSRGVVLALQRHWATCFCAGGSHTLFGSL